MNLVLNRIIYSLKNNPSEWTYKNLGARTLEHKSGLTIWMDNVPVLNTNIYKPYKLSLSLCEKFRLYQATKNVTNAKITEMLG
jgi:hypothetical protein